MGKSIYEISSPGSPSWISTKSLEALLKKKVIGLDLNSYPIRTRSKVVKVAICEAIGYETPSSFKKTKPRFPCQNLDVYTQKSNNLQIWNEELARSRRYALIKLNKEGIVKNVKVVTGDDLIPLDKTGKLTKKYQAAYRKRGNNSTLLSLDSTRLENLFCAQSSELCLSKVKPTDNPKKGVLMTIGTIFEKLNRLVGISIPFVGGDQERNRGAELH